MHLVGHLKHVLLDLQASWVMWLLLVLSVASVGLIVERTLYFFGRRDDLAALQHDLDGLLRGQKYREALVRLEGSRSPAAVVTIAGMRHADLGPVAAEKAMAGALALERMRLERGLAFLGTLGNNAPFVGLLGTVIGVIEAFEALGAQEGGVSGQVSTALMAGIAEALVATAVGLFVAIPAVAAFNYFQRKITQAQADTEALTNVLLAHLSAEEPLPPAGGK